MSTSVNIDESDVAGPNSVCWEVIFCNAVNQQLLDKERNIQAPEEMLPCEKYFLFSNSVIQDLPFSSIIDLKVVNQDYVTPN